MKVEIDSRVLELVAQVASTLDLADDLGFADAAIHLNQALVVLDGIGRPAPFADQPDKAAAPIPMVIASNSRFLSQRPHGTG